MHTFLFHGLVRLYRQFFSFSTQDVRLPLAGLGMIVERYCLAHKIPDHRNVLPLIHHILLRYLTSLSVMVIIL